MHISSLLLCSVTIIFRTNYHYRCALEILRNKHYSKYIYIPPNDEKPSASPSFTLNGNNSLLFLLLFFVSFHIYLIRVYELPCPAINMCLDFFVDTLCLFLEKGGRTATWTPEIEIPSYRPQKPMDCSSGTHKHRQHNGLFFGQMMSWQTFQGMSLSSWVPRKGRLVHNMSWSTETLWYVHHLEPTKSHTSLKEVLLVDIAESRNLTNGTP